MRSNLSSSSSLSQNTIAAPTCDLDHRRRRGQQRRRPPSSRHHQRQRLPPLDTYLGHRHRHFSYTHEGDIFFLSAKHHYHARSPTKTQPMLAEGCQRRWWPLSTSCWCRHRCCSPLIAVRNAVALSLLRGGSIPLPPWLKPKYFFSKLLHH